MTYYIAIDNVIKRPSYRTKGAALAAAAAMTGWKVAVIDPRNREVYVRYPQRVNVKPPAKLGSN